MGEHFFLMAQRANRYPLVEGFGHHVYLEGYELPIMNSGPMDPAPSPAGDEIAFGAKGWLWVMDLGTDSIAVLDVFMSTTVAKGV
jgi:TolB protein